MAGPPCSAPSESKPRPITYVGIDADLNGGMTSIGKIIRDAWVFGLLDRSETCVGWDASRINLLQQQTNDEWDKYGCMVSQLPSDMYLRHQEIHGQGIARAVAAGWSGELELVGDE